MKKLKNLLFGVVMLALVMNLGAGILIFAGVKFAIVNLFSGIVMLLTLFKGFGTRFPLATRRIVGVTVGSVLLFGVSLVFFQPHPQYDFKQTSVKVMGPMGHGSGSVVDSSQAGSLILTNRHVCVGTLNPSLFYRVEAQANMCDYNSNPRACYNRVAKLREDKYSSLLGKKLKIQFNNLKLDVLSGEIIKISPNYDLCLVKVKIGNLPKVRIADTRANPGDYLITVGNPSIVTNHMTDGYAGDDIQVWGNTYTGTTAEIYGGSSGSAVFNANHALVGVNTLGRREPTINFMIPLQDIITFLQGNMMNRKINTVIKGMK